jgi:hypothetical protein
LTIFCPPCSVGLFGAENPGVVLVIILPLCKKKAGFDSYEKRTLSLGAVVEDKVTLVVGESGGWTICAVRQTVPYAAQARERYGASAEAVRYTVCIVIGSSSKSASEKS